jgi:hypothetical protein
MRKVFVSGLIIQISVDKQCNYTAQAVPSLNLYGFLQSPIANIGTLPQIKLRLLPSISFPIH